MAIYQPESFYSTSLASPMTTTDTTISVTVAPNITAGYMVIEANTSNREIIKYTAVSGTTLTGVVRGLATYGSDDSAGTGKSHAAGVEIANKDVHYYYAQYYDFLTGVSATGSNSMSIGDGNTISASNRLWYANTSSLSGFWGMSANGQMVVSEDGATSYVISAGGSGVTAGDGIDITAGVVSIDRLSASGLRISANKLAVNPGQGISATSAGELYVDLTHDYAWTGTHAYTTGPVSARTIDSVSATIEQLTLETTNVSALYGGTTSDADDLHTHDSLAGQVTFDTTQVYSSSPSSSYTDLDLSSVVGSNQAVVFLRITTNDSHIYSFRKNGETLDATPISIYSGVHLVRVENNGVGYVMMVTDASGIVEWKTSSENGTTTIKLEAYWK